MTEHLHGYPPCATPAGQPCAPSDLAYEECKAHGALRGCEPSIVDGIPTGSYRCAHDDKAAAPASRAAKKKPAKKPMKAKKAKAAPARKAAKKSAGKKGAKRRPARAAKKAGKAKPAKKAKKASKSKKARRR